MPITVACVNLWVQKRQRELIFALLTTIFVIGFGIFVITAFNLRLAKSGMTDCFDFYRNGVKTSGIYTIEPLEIEPFQVYCDMETNGGGWTVIQRRQDDGLIFWNRSWHEYKTGFSSGLDKSYWLGLEFIHVLSVKDSNVTLRIDLWGNRCIGENCLHFSKPFDPNGYWYGEYQIKVENEDNNYRLHVTMVGAGNISTRTDFREDTFYYDSNNSFTTVDRNNVLWWSDELYRSCAEKNHYGHFANCVLIPFHHLSIIYNDVTTSLIYTLLLNVIKSTGLLAVIWHLK